MNARNVLVGSVLACGLLTGCVQHMVGPARTADDYRRKAHTTAADALSTVETVIVVADASDRGNTFGPYASVSVSEQEDRLDEIVGDFGSIQPPDATADQVRAELNDILGTALDDIAAVRIALRRGLQRGLAAVAAPLERDSEQLDAFIERLSESS